MGNLVLHCLPKCVPMDEFGIWSIFTDTLYYVKPKAYCSVTCSYDQRRHQNSKTKYFDAAFSNVSNDENISVDQNYNSKKENFDAANCNEPNVYHPLGSVLQSPSRKLNRNWIGPLRIQIVLDNTHHLCSYWSGMLIPKRFHTNRLKQYYMNLGKLDKNGQLKIVKNVNKLYDMWNDLKEDELPKESSQETDNGEDITAKL